MTNYRGMSDEDFPSAARTANGRDPGEAAPSTYLRIEAACRMLQDSGDMTPMATRQILRALRVELGMPL